MKKSEKSSYGSLRLCASCAAGHQPCSPVLCALQHAALSSSASAGRRDATRMEETKPPSMQFWVSAWTAPGPRRWKRQLSCSPAVALSVIFPGEVCGDQYLWCEG